MVRLEFPSKMLRFLRIEHLAVIDALEVEFEPGLNVLTGETGAGKSMLAQRLPGLLPPLDAREALEISMIQSLAGALEEGAISRRRPFRNPHHSASMAALVGGGLKVKPGEVSLAHLGVLFLDELPEFPVLGSNVPSRH